MKTISAFFILILFSFMPSINGQDLNAFWKDADLFFSTYAQHHSVQYHLLQKDNKDIQSLVNQIASISLNDVSILEQKAFYINAYNLLVIDNVVEHFPIASPNEIVEFWDGIEYSIAGKKYNLKQLKQTILETYSDARLHFVLCDGILSFAPITDNAYHPTLLEKQLENQTIEFLNSSKNIDYNDIDRTITLPFLFKEYSTDFKPTIFEFINNYRVQKIAPNSTIKFSNKDCSLNYYFGNVDYSIDSKKNKIKSEIPTALTTTLPKNAVELIFFNSLFTATYGDESSGTRSSYLNGYFSAYYGVTGTLDIGMSFLIRSSRINDYYTSSPFKTFEFERTQVSAASTRKSNRLYSDWGFSHLGVQVRFAPFKKINLTFEQGILLPIKGLPKENTIDESIYIISQVYYIHTLSLKWQLFFGLTFWQPIQPGKAFSFQPPMLRVFLNYFTTPRLSFFVTNMYLVEWGIGCKFLLTPKFEIQALYSYFLPIPELLNVFSSGSTSVMTYNLGLRYRF